MSLAEHFSYDPRTGKIYWVKVTRNARIGQEAGTPDGKGYIKVTLNRKGYRAHRVAWFLHYGEWPAGEIDHINANRLDNRISNLRVATRGQNAANMRLRKKNGYFKGCYWNSTVQKWQAKFRNRSIGYFMTEAQASSAYMNEAKRHYGEYARPL